MILVTILVTLLIFGLLITVHELGHYLVARASNVAILEFSIGMGPKIKSWEGKVNTFSLRAIPIGGRTMRQGCEVSLPLIPGRRFPLEAMPWP